MDNLKIIIKSLVVVGVFMAVMTAIATIQVNIRDDIKSIKDDIKALSTVLQESD